MKYRIMFRRAVLREMRIIPRNIRKRIWATIDALRENPFPEGKKKIRGQDDYYRIRVGQYRVIYCVAKAIRIVTIIKVGHRKDVYRFLQE